MNAQQRRQAIQALLEQADAPLSASALARRFSVSRQIIVGDVALLRAAGANISATPRGYAVVTRPLESLLRQVACRHDDAQMEAELNAIVDQGCTVVDVIVEHPLYGQLTGSLQLSSRYDVTEFIRRCDNAHAQPLSRLTEGIHLHTLSCPSIQAFDRTQAALAELGILLPES